MNKKLINHRNVIYLPHSPRSRLLVRIDLEAFTFLLSSMGTKQRKASINKTACKSLSDTFTASTTRKHSQECKSTSERHAIFVKSYNSHQNYICQTAKFGDDILNDGRINYKHDFQYGTVLTFDL